MRSRALWTAVALAASVAGCATTAGEPVRTVEAYSAGLAQSVEPLSYPYTALHERGGRKLAFVAAAHSVDPQSPTHLAVRDAFEQVRPAAVIIEGFPTELGETPKVIAAIAAERDEPDAQPYARGEAGYAASLALAAGVPFLGGEPTEQNQTAGLIAQGFDALDIFHTDLLKMLVASVNGGEITGPADPRFDEVFARWTVSLSIASLCPRRACGKQRVPLVFRPR